MASPRMSTISAILERVKSHVSIPQNLEDQSALNALKTRLINIVINNKYGAKLFNDELLSLYTLEAATTLEQIRDTVDNYLAIADFYEKHHAAFDPIIQTEWFRNKVKGGDLHYWNIIIDKPINYHTLSTQQLITSVVDAFTRLKHEPHDLGLSIPVEPIPKDIPPSLPLAVSNLSALEPITEQETVKQEIQKLKSELELQNKVDEELQEITNGISKAINNLPIWSERGYRFFFCGSGTGLPAGIREMQEQYLAMRARAVIDSVLTVSQTKELLNSYITIAERRIEETSVFTNRRKETKEFYEFLMGMAPLLSNKESFADKLAMIESARKFLIPYLNITDHAEKMRMSV